MTWLDAFEWCKSLGNEFELPSKEVLNACYQNENICKQFKLGWYWSSTMHSENLSWGQCFITGYQTDYEHDNNSYVRAVRKVVISTG